MAKSLQQLSVAVEERPRQGHRSAPNCTAVLPPSCLHGAFIAVVSNGSCPCRSTPSHSGTAAAPPPPSTLCLHIYALTVSLESPPVTCEVADASPDMMLISSVALSERDLCRAPAACTSSSNPRKSPMDAPDTASLHTTAWMGCQFLATRSNEERQAPAYVQVQRISWVGIAWVVIKTSEGQLLLVRTGLTAGTGPSSLASDDEEGEEAHAASLSKAGAPANDDLSAVKATFARVADFCSATVPSDPLESPASLPKGALAVLVVAGLQNVTGVVCAASPEREKSRHGTPSLGLSHTDAGVRQYTWSIGPFGHVAAAATDVSPSLVCICGTTRVGTVEVYSWKLPTESSPVLPPVCLHHVLLSPENIFYGVAVAAGATAAVDPGHIAFWILGGAVAARDASPASPPPALCGLDGRPFEVERPSPQPQGIQGSPGTLQYLAETGIGAPRTLNSLWAPLRETPATSSVDCTTTRPASSLSSTGVPLTASPALGVIASLRITEPPFLPLPTWSGGTTTSSSAGCELAQRYILLVENVGVTPDNHSATALNSSDVLTTAKKEERHSEVWRCSALPLDSEDAMEALRWLSGSKESNAAPDTHPPPCTMAPVALVYTETQNRSSHDVSTPPYLVHEILLHTPHRVLRASVRHKGSARKGEPSRLEWAVEGTHETAPSNKFIGVACLSTGLSQPSLTFFLSGAVSTARPSKPDPREIELSPYGQETPRIVWNIVYDVHAALLKKLSSWKAFEVAAVEEYNRSSVLAKEGADESAVLLEVQQMIRAEGARLQQHLDTRLDRLENMLIQCLSTSRKA